MAALVKDSERKTPARLAGSAILALQSDDRLVKLVRSGHERAFEVIVERYRKQLVRFAARILPESRTEDAVQQAFINAHAGLLASDEAVQLKPWLFAITRNASLNMLRQNGWNYEQIPLDFDGVRRPDQVFEQRIELQQTVAAMNELPERQRNALVMRELEGRSYDEIALALGANDGAVRQLLNRARGTLRAAASALVPPPLVARAAASMPQADGRRLAEIFGGLGAAGIAKAGATALVAGSLVVGAVKAPLPIVKDKTTREKATLTTGATSAAKKRGSATVVAAVPIAQMQHSARSQSPSRKRASSNRGRGSTRLVPTTSGPSHRTQTDGSGEDRSPGGDDSRDRSGSGSDDSTTRTRSGSDDSKQSGSGDRSGTSGSGDSTTTVVESDDHTTTTTETTSSSSGDSGSSGSGDSTSSGSGTSGSGTSGSGTSGSGSSGSDDTVTSLDH